MAAWGLAGGPRGWRAPPFQGLLLRDQKSLPWVGGGRAGDEIYVFKKMELKAFNLKS